MTPWELTACVDGYSLANGGEEEPDPLSPEDFAAMIDSHRAIVTRH